MEKLAKKIVVEKGVVLVGTKLTHVERKLLAEEKPEDPTSVGSGVYAESGGNNYFPAFLVDKSKKITMHLGTYNANDKEGLIGFQVRDIIENIVLATAEADKGAFRIGRFDLDATIGFDKSRVLEFAVGRATAEPHVYEVTHSTLVGVNVKGDTDYGIYANVPNYYAGYDDSKPYVVLGNPALYGEWIPERAVYKRKQPPTLRVPYAENKLKFRGFNIGDATIFPRTSAGYSFIEPGKKPENLTVLYEEELGYWPTWNNISYIDATLPVPKLYSKSPVLLGFGHTEGWWVWSEYKPDTAQMPFQDGYPLYDEYILQYGILVPGGLTESDLRVVVNNVNDALYWEGIAGRAHKIVAWPVGKEDEWVIEEHVTFAGYTASPAIPLIVWVALIICGVCGTASIIALTGLGKDVVKLWEKKIHPTVCPYQCEWCGNCFNEYEELLRHRDICPKKPEKEEDYAPPNKGKDPETGYYLCPLCGVPYGTTWAAYWGHMKAVHPEELPEEVGAKLTINTKRWNIPTLLPVTIELQSYEGFPILGNWVDVKGYPKEVEANPSEHLDFVATRDHRVKATRGKRIITEMCSEWEEVGMPEKFDDKKITLSMRRRLVIGEEEED